MEASGFNTTAPKIHKKCVQGIRATSDPLFPLEPPKGTTGQDDFLTHTTCLVRPFKCMHILQSQNCPEEFIYDISWLSAGPLPAFKVGCLRYCWLWETEIKMSPSLYSLNIYLSIIDYMLDTVPGNEIQNWSKKHPVSTLMKLTGWEEENNYILI